MSNEDKTTIKVRAYPDDGKRAAPKSNLTEEQDNALELIKKTAQHEDAKKKLQVQERTIEQLRDSLAKELAKSSELAKKLSKLEIEHKLMQDSSAKVTELETKVKELSEMLGKISGIASSGKTS